MKRKPSHCVIRHNSFRRTHTRVGVFNMVQALLLLLTMSAYTRQ